MSAITNILGKLGIFQRLVVNGTELRGIEDWTPVEGVSPAILEFSLSPNTTLTPVANGVTLTSTLPGGAPSAAATESAFELTAQEVGFYARINDTVPEQTVGYLTFTDDVADWFTLPGALMGIFIDWNVSENMYEVNIQIGDSEYWGYDDSFLIADVLNMDVCVSVKLDGLDATVNVWFNDGAHTSATPPTFTFTQTLLASEATEIAEALTRVVMSQFSETLSYLNYSTPPLEYDNVEFFAAGGIVDPESYPEVTSNTTVMVVGLSENLKLADKGVIKNGYLATFKFDRTPQVITKDKNYVDQDDHELNGFWRFLGRVGLIAETTNISYQGQFAPETQPLSSLLTLPTLIDADIDGNIIAETGKYYYDTGTFSSTTAFMDLGEDTPNGNFVWISNISGSLNPTSGYTLRTADGRDFMIGGEDAGFNSILVEPGKSFRIVSGAYTGAAGNSSEGGWHLFDLSGDASSGLIGETTTNFTKVGVGAGGTTTGSVAFGANAGFNQSSQCVAVGHEAGQLLQSQGSVAIGYEAAQLNQGQFAVAIGYQAGQQNSQGAFAIAVGWAAGNNNQGADGIAIGRDAALTNQASDAISIGAKAGETSQGFYAVSVGSNAGATSQSPSGIAIGYFAAEQTQGAQGISIGREAGRINQGANGISVGYRAAQNNQGDYALAMGFGAAVDSQPETSIVLSASSISGQNVDAIGDILITTGIRSIAVNVNGFYINNVLVEAFNNTSLQNYVAAGSIRLQSGGNSGNNITLSAQHAGGFMNIFANEDISIGVAAGSLQLSASSEVTVNKDPTAPLGVATKQYSDKQGIPGFTEIGGTTLVPNVSFRTKTAAVGDNHVALVDDDLNTLTMYKVTGNAFVQVGNTFVFPFTSAIQNRCDVVVLTPTRVAVYHDTSSSYDYRLEAYDWDGTNWTSVGTMGPTNDSGSVSIMAQLSDGRIAVISGLGGASAYSLQTFDFTGSAFVTVGQPMIMVDIISTRSDMAKVDSGTIAMIYGFTANATYIKVFSFNGASWTESYSDNSRSAELNNVDGITYVRDGYYVMNDFVTYGSLQTYFWDGNTIIPQADTVSGTIHNRKISVVNLNQNSFVSFEPTSELFSLIQERSVAVSDATFNKFHTQLNFDIVSQEDISFEAQNITVSQAPTLPMGIANRQFVLDNVAPASGTDIFWGNISSLVGELSTPGLNFSTIAPLGGPWFAVIDESSRIMTPYEYTGKTFNESGATIAIGGSGSLKGASMGFNRMVVHSGSDLTTRDWDGDSSWVTVGSVGSVAGVITNMVAITNELMVMLDTVTDSLKVLSFAGEVWNQIGSDFPLPVSSNGWAIVRISNNRIAISATLSPYMAMLEWDGVTWTTVGNSVAIIASQMVVLNDTDVLAVMGSAVAVYRHNGTEFAQVGPATTIVNISSISSLSANEFLTYNTQTNLMTAYSVGYSVKQSPSDELLGYT